MSKRLSISEVLGTLAVWIPGAYYTRDWGSGDWLFLFLLIGLVVSAIRLALIVIPWWFKR